MERERKQFLNMTAARVRVLLGFAILLSALAIPNTVGAAPSAPAIRYALDLRETSSHRVSVTMTVPDAPPALDIQFPAWNALYQIRDFERNVIHITAQCEGRRVKLTHVDLNTWRAAAEPCTSLELSYSVYINEESVFASVLNDDHCFMNLAMLLFYLPQQREREVRIKFVLPDGWTLATLLDEPRASGEYSAPNYDALVDCPVEAAPAPASANQGNFHEFSYQQKSATYRVEVFGNPADYSPERLLTSLQKITAAETDLMREVPFSRYTFIFHFLRNGGGGMEHRNGTAIGVGAAGLRSNMSGVESVAAHEFFHAWNVKRIRPQGLEPVDYVHGNDTGLLWFSEGVTSTYGELSLERAGLISRQEFYRRIGQEIGQLQQRPARLTQSVEDSGREAWLEKYSDYRQPERSISYYNKGELIGFLLDLAIRHASGSQHSLDDVMRRLNSDFAQRGRFFTQADLRALTAQMAPGFTVLDSFFNDYVSGVTELDYDTYLGYAGLRVAGGEIEQTSPGFRLGRREDRAIEVQSVDPGSQAEKAGLKQGDVVIQINGHPLTDSFRQELTAMKPGQKLELRVLRDSRKRKIKFSLGSRSQPEYHIEEVKSATPEQLEVRKGWLEGRTAGQ
jgi:predicted metalloprotease with PDZ domain